MYHSISYSTSGDIMILGGIDTEERILSSAEIYEPENNRWRLLELGKSHSDEHSSNGSGTKNYPKKMWYNHTLITFSL